MKLDFNKKYTTIAVYTVLTVLAIMIIGTVFVNFSGVSAFISFLNKILMPFFIGLAIAYVANPIMVMAEKHIFRFKVTTKRRARFKRCLSIILALVILLIAVSIIFLLIIPQVVLSVSDLVSKLSGYIDHTVAFLDSILPDAIFDSANLTIENFFDSIIKYLTDSAIGDELNTLSDKLNLVSANLDTIISNSFTIIKDYVPMILGAFTGVANGLLNVILGIFFAIYTLSSKEKLIAQLKKLIRAFSTDKAYDEILELGHFSNKTFGGYLLGKVLDSIIVGVVMFIVCAICKIPYAILVSSLVGITNIIPVIGPFIGAIPGALIIFIVDPSKVLWFIVINVIIQQIDGNIIVPKVLGETTGLSSLWVLFSITVMGGIWGLFGMFISVPIFAILYMLMKKIVERRLVKREIAADTKAFYPDEESMLFADESVDDSPSRPRLTLVEKIKSGVKEKFHPKDKGDK